MQTLRLGFVAGFMFFAASGAAQAKVGVDLGQASEKDVVFNAVGKPSFLKIEGKGTGLSGTIYKDGANFSGQAEFALDTLDTDMDLRNKHMKEKYLETGKYPKATLSIKKLPWGKSDDGDFAETEGPFEGMLTLHGVTKPVSGTATISRSGSTVKTHVTFKASIPDFGIEIPSFKGVTVAETVDVTVDATAPVVK